MYSKCFEFACLRLRFLSEAVIDDTEGYGDFRCADTGDFYDVTVQNRKLPEKNGRQVFYKVNHSCCESDGVYSFYSSYFDIDEMSHRDITCFIPGKTSGIMYVDYPDGMWDKMIFEALFLPETLLMNGSALLHSSCVEYNGEAILFTAGKQVGKSTQAALWNKYENARIINGDRMALRKTDGRLYAYGTPYRGTSDVGLNESLPVKAIVCLSQSEGNTVTRLRGALAAVRLLDCISFDAEIPALAAAATEIASFAVESVPIYALACTPDERAVTELKNAIDNQ